MRDAEYVTCENCGMGWPTRRLCEHCAFRAGGADPSCETCKGTGEAGLTPAHRCPEPMPYEIARLYADTAQSMAARGSPMIVSPRIKAQIKLGLRGTHTDS